MASKTFFRLLAGGLAGWLAGCVAAAPPRATLLGGQPPVLCWSDSLVGYGGAWQKLAEARVHKPCLVVVCHGCDGPCGGWWLAADKQRPMMAVRDVAWTLHKLHPDWEIVLIVCNVSGEPLDVPGVLYAKKAVWVVPGADKRGTEDAVGNIDEFVAN